MTRVDEGVKIYFQQPDLKIAAYVGQVGAGGVEGWTKGKPIVWCFVNSLFANLKILREQ